MEAKDTVIPVEERIKMGVWHGRERQAQAQAKVSFKAGIRRVVDELEGIFSSAKSEREVWIGVRELTSKWEARLKNGG